MSVQPNKTLPHVTLRHWTIDPLSFVGGRQRPGPARADREDGDGRRLNLVASKLSSIRAELACRNA
jgi:hypothetical protein